MDNTESTVKTEKIADLNIFEVSQDSEVHISTKIIDNSLTVEQLDQILDNISYNEEIHVHVVCRAL